MCRKIFSVVAIVSLTCAVSCSANKSWSVREFNQHKATPYVFSNFKIMLQNFGRDRDRHKRVSNIIAKKLPIDVIKRQLENKYGIVIDVSEFKNATAADFANSPGFKLNDEFMMISLYEWKATRQSKNSVELVYSMRMEQARSTGLGFSLQLMVDGEVAARFSENDGYTPLGRSQEELLELLLNGVTKIPEVIQERLQDVE